MTAQNVNICMNLGYGRDIANACQWLEVSTGCALETITVLGEVKIVIASENQFPPCMGDAGILGGDSYGGSCFSFPRHPEQIQLLGNALAVPHRG